MPAGDLRAWLDGGRDRLVWIEFDDYAHRVFAGGAADWLRDANVFVGGVSQAQGVVASEVLSIDVLAPYLAHLEPCGDDARETVQSMLQLEAPRDFVNDVVDALAHRFGDHIDLVLKVPSPGDLLRRAGLGGDASFDELDDIGVGLSNVLREFSTKPLAGVLVASSGPLSLDEDEALESVTGVARHYQWCVALSLEGAAAVPAEAPRIDADLLLLPAVRTADLRDAAASALVLGGGLGTGYWQADGEIPDRQARGLLYGAIPADTQPELVVKRVADALG
jgi:hypothetical protein